MKACTLLAPCVRLAQRPVARRRVRGCAAQRCVASAAAQREVLVVGGGAAGLTAAFFAAAAGARVTILERNAECGKKILMSGGTRANVLPLAFDTESDFFSESPKGALRRLLESWPLDDVRTWLSTDVGIKLALEEATGKWFPAANSGRHVRDLLVAACKAQGASVRHNASVERLARTPDGARWEATLAGGAVHTADAVVMSTGGLSFAAVGTDGTGHRIAVECLGHAMHEPFPALVPLYGAHPGTEGPAGLAGVSLQTVVLRAGEGAKATKAHRGGFLFTHRGYSGPAVLDLSHRHVVAAAAAKQQQPQQPTDAAKPAKAAKPPPRLLADWSGEGRAAWEARLSAAGSSLVSTRVASALPARLAAALCASAGVPPDRKAAELRKDERARLLDALTSYALPVTGDAGFPKAEVSGGGVPLHELRLDTLESRKAPGVFLCGEIIDAFGRIGGFNFLLAWCTGRLAGLGAAAAPTAAASTKSDAR